MHTYTYAQLQDCRRLAELEILLFTCDRISYRQFRYLLTKANALVIKKELGDVLAGYLVLLKRANSTGLRIYSLGVHPDARKRGIARQLLACAEMMAPDHGCDRLTLEVSIDNHPAIDLYRASGFCPCGIKVEYYEDGGTALVMRKRIDWHPLESTAMQPQSHRPIRLPLPFTLEKAEVSLEEHLQAPLEHHGLRPGADKPMSNNAPTHDHDPS